MVIRFDKGIVVRHDDLIGACYRDNASTGRQLDLIHGASDDLRGALIPVGNRFDSLGCAATQTVHNDNITAAYMRQQRANGGLLLYCQASECLDNVGSVQGQQASIC